MSYQEKRSLVNLVSAILVTTLYSVFMMQRYPQADPYAREIFHFWGAFFLILIPISIVARILIYIVFHILNAIATREEQTPVTDERDKLSWNCGPGSLRLYVFAVGVMLAMGALVVEQPPAAMFIILICAGAASEIVSEMAQFYFYRRGF